MMMMKLPVEDEYDYDTEVNKEEEEEAEEEEEEEEKLPVIMAEFDLFLDDSSIIYNDEQFTSLHHHQSASSRHAITNLVRAANTWTYNTISYTKIGGVVAVVAVVEVR